ncbi:hypothetical protein AB4254_11960 [Vibrio breoganii]
MTFATYTKYTVAVYAVLTITASLGLGLFLLIAPNTATQTLSNGGFIFLALALLTTEFNQGKPVRVLIKKRTIFRRFLAYMIINQSALFSILALYVITNHLGWHLGITEPDASTDGWAVITLAIFISIAILLMNLVTKPIRKHFINQSLTEKTEA